MILGLDVSTSIVGVCIYDDKKEQIVKTDYIDLRKVGGLLHKAQAVENYINQNLLQHNIDYIFIEEALMQRFNGVVSWLCFKSLNIEPRYVTPISARSRCGIKVPRGKKAKDVVMEHFVQSGEFPIEYTRYGNVQKYCYDIADAVVVAKAASKIMLDT